MKRIKKIIMLGIVLSISLMITGCRSEFFEYITRENVGDATEKYLEEKYGGDFTVLDYRCEQSFTMFWNNHNWLVALTCDTLPDQIMTVRAIVNTETNSYTFYERYQSYYHLNELDKLVRDTAQKYYTGKYYINVDICGSSNASSNDIAMMNISDYSNTGERFEVTIITEGMKEETSLTNATLIQNEIENDYGIFCTWYLYSITKLTDTSIESKVCDENGKFVYDNVSNMWREGTLSIDHKPYKKYWN